MSIVKYPVSTEKAIRLREYETRFTFVVDKRATKGEIVQELESTFGIHVVRINTLIGPNGIKKAIVTLQSQDEVVELASKLGLM